MYPTKYFGDLLILNHFSWRVKTGKQMSLASSPDCRTWLLFLSGDPPFALWWGSTLQQVSVSWAPGRLWDLGGYYLTHSSRNWDAESCVKERPHWGSLWKGLNASFLPVVSTPDSRGLHFNPVNGEMWSHKNTSFSFLQNKKSIRTRVVCFSSVSRVLRFLAAPLLVSNPFFPPSCPLVLCLGGPTVQEKSRGSFWIFCFSPFSFYFLWENDSDFLIIKVLSAFCRNYKMSLECCSWVSTGSEIWQSLINNGGGSDSEGSVCSAGDLGSIPGLGRSPGEGNDPQVGWCISSPYPC